MRSRRLLTAALVLLGVGVTSEAHGQGTVSGWVRNGGTPIMNAAVYLTSIPDTVAGPSLPLLTIDQAHLRFVPSVVVVTPGTPVAFVNSDGVRHNVFGPGGAVGHDFDLGTYDQGESRIEVFEEEGVHIVLCHIHPEMVAYVLVANTPYRAVTNGDGTWTMNDVPPGRYQLHAWHGRRWRDEMVEEITIGAEGLAEVLVTLGPNGSIR